MLASSVGVFAEADGWSRWVGARHGGQTRSDEWHSCSLDKVDGQAGCHGIASEGPLSESKAALAAMGLV